MNVLAIGLDYLMLNKNSVRGDVRERQLDYANRLNEFYLVVYSPKNQGLKKEEWLKNLHVYPTNSRSKLSFISDVYKICSMLCKAKKIDVITAEDPFTTGLIGYLLKKKFKIPLNVQAHIDFFDNVYWMRMRPLNRLLNALGKFICKRADTIRVVASETKEKLEKYGIPSEKISLISVHSDLTRFQAVEGSVLRKQLLGDKYERILIFVGRLVDQKDIPNLLKAFKLILEKKPKTLLLIIGDGPKKNILKNMVKNLGIGSNVTFAGAITHSLVPQYYAASDIFVLPSLFEGRATVIVEALLSKKPIVSTAVSGLKEWMRDGDTGFIVEQRNPAVFAEKVIYLLDNPEIAHQFGEKGFIIAKQNSKEIQDVSSMIELWKKTAQCKVG